jgi:hypothetical protein
VTDNDCPQCGLERAKVVGVEVWGVYDGVLYWHCPACGWAWHRWPEGRDLHARADRYVTAAQRAWAAAHKAEARRDCRLCSGSGVMQFDEGGIEGEHACPHCA